MKKSFIIYSIILLLFFLLPISAHAKKTLADADSALSDVVGPSGIDESDLGTAARSVVKGVLSAVGLLFFCLMVYAGIVWMTAQGDDARVTKARDTIIAASIGMVIIVASYAITNLVVEKIIAPGSPIDGGSGEEFGPKPNTIGGDVLICCVVPAVKTDWVQASPMTYSVTSEEQCTADATEIFEDETDAKRGDGNGWEMYLDITDTITCGKISACWNDNVGAAKEKACLQNIYKEVDAAIQLQAQKQAAADAAAQKKDWKWCIIDKECVEGNIQYCPDDVNFETKTECTEAYNKLKEQPKIQICKLNTTKDPCSSINEDSCVKEQFCQLKDGNCTTSITEEFCNASSIKDCETYLNDGYACILKSEPI